MECPKYQIPILTLPRGPRGLRLLKFSKLSILTFTITSSKYYLSTMIILRWIGILAAILPLHYISVKMRPLGYLRCLENLLTLGRIGGWVRLGSFRSSLPLYLEISAFGTLQWEERAAVTDCGPGIPEVQRKSQFNQQAARGTYQQAASSSSSSSSSTRQPDVLTHCPIAHLAYRFAPSACLLASPI